MPEMSGKQFPYLEEKENSVKVQTYGRTYTYDKAVLPTSIISQGKELLSRPVNFVLKANGKDMIFEPALVLPTEYSQEGCTVVATMESELFFVNTMITTEEDGCAFVNVSLMPKGFTVRQIFGLEPMQYHERLVEHFWLDIPIQKDVTMFYHVSPDSILLGDFPKDAKKELLFADFIPKGGFATNFTSQVMLCGEEVGLGVFFTTREGWNIADKSRAIEVLEREDEYIIRVHFLDGSPKAWGESCKNAEIATQLIPVTFKFGFMATPMKELPKRPFVERSFHVDCFKKITTDYEVYFSNPVVAGSDEIGFDRIQRLGVKTLYIHEKWNDMQNSPILTDRTKRRLSYIVQECHKRGIKVIPYFGFELSSLSPYFAEYGRKMLCLTSPAAETMGSWNRWPAQRALRVCQSGPWGEKFVEGVKRIVEEFDLDGLYLDCMYGAFECGNLEHGCGFIEDGEIVETFTSEGVRKTVKGLYRFIQERGGVINCHGFGAMTLPALYYCSTLWEGENFQSMFMQGSLSKMPEGHLRALYTGVNFGIPVYSLCYSNPPKWTYSNAISMALLHNSMPKPVDIGEPLEETSKIWDIYDAFPFEDSEWHPYFHNDVVQVSHAEIKVSYYETEEEVLAVCASTERDFSGTVELNFTALNLYEIENAMTGEFITRDGTHIAEFDGFQYLLLRGMKKRRGGE